MSQANTPTSYEERKIGFNWGDFVNHIGTQAHDNYRADAVHRREKFAEAEADYWRSLTGRGKALGADRLSTLPSGSNLAGMQFSQGKFTEADSLCRRAPTRGGRCQELATPIL